MNVIYIIYPWHNFFKFARSCNMKSKAVKYLITLICLFSVLEKTGVSVLSVFAHVNSVLTEWQQTKEDSNANEKEAKQAEVKEFWATYDQLSLLMPPNAPLLTEYTTDYNINHSVWYPPVPNPPPTLA